MTKRFVTALKLLKWWLGQHLEQLHDALVGPKQKLIIFVNSK